MVQLWRRWNTAGILNGETYERIIDKEFRWKEWAYPKTVEGKLNYDNALTGDDLLEFVNKELVSFSLFLITFLVAMLLAMPSSGLEPETSPLPREVNTL